MNRLTLSLLLCTSFAANAQVQPVQNKILKNIERQLPELDLNNLSVPNEAKKSKVLYDYKCREASLEATPSTPKEVVMKAKAEKRFVVPFKSGQSGVESEVSSRIFTYLETLKKTGQLLKVHIVGHTDSDQLGPVGRRKYGDNVGLSKARARRVADFIYKSYPDVAVSYNGYGYFRPIASNLSAAGKQKNRRVEVNFYLRKTSSFKSFNGAQKTSPKSLLKTDSDSPFKITLDGESLNEAGKSKQDVDVQRCTDMALEGASLQIRYEPLVASKYLNVTQSFTDGEMSFIINSNYSSFINRAELILLDAQSGAVLARKDFEKDSVEHQLLSLRLKANVKNALQFKVKVYDRKNRFDETAPQFVNKFNEKINYSNLYQNRIAINGIPVYGGTVTVNGNGVPKTHSVYVMGKKVPLDLNGKFAESQILKSNSNYGIEVAVKSPDNKGLFLKRDFYMPSEDWRFVGLADVTVGQNKSDGPVALVTQDLQHYDNQVFVDGRLALYLKGKIKGKYLLTMQVDTLESTLEDAFKNINQKDPQKLFRRIDPDEYYPIYGDDSTLIEDAPSQGRFYVRIDKGENHILWGNFKVNSASENLAGVQRGLYGLKLHLETADQTKFGEKVANLDVYAAEPGSLPAREESRGTGGTVYFLRNQDIVEGSERIQILVRDRVSGLIEGSRSLSRGTDYTLNSLAGIIYLKTPLNSTASSTTVVSNNNIAGDPVYLVANYEYTPTFTDLDTLSLGGRGELSLGSRLRLGATGSKQDFISSEHELYGLDAQVKIGSASLFKAESAVSKGFGPSQYTSIDGGFGFNQIPQTLNPNEKARALKLETDLNLYSLKGRNASLKASFSDKEAGFASPGHLSLYETLQAKSELQLPVSSWLELRGRYGLRDQKLWLYSEEAGAEIGLGLGSQVQADLGLLTNKVKDQSGTGQAGASLATDFGERTDLGLKLTYNLSPLSSVYVKAQNTLSKDQTRMSNDRYGLGVSTQIGKSIRLSGEITDGDLEVGGKLETEYTQNENTSFYVNYLLENNRTDGGFSPRQVGRNGSVTSGVKSKFLTNSSVFYENRLVDQYGTNRSQSLTHAMGLDWQLNSNWTYNITGEFGRVESLDLSTRLDRTALSASIGYVDKNTKWSTALEFRRDDAGASVRKTVVTKNRFLKKINSSFRLKAKFDKIDSSDSQGQFFDGDLTDAVLALAYRPVLQDRFNALFKLRYFEYLPAPGQVNASGQSPDYLQRSLVANMDSIWDLSKTWSLGLKYGTALRRQKNFRSTAASSWIKSTPQLVILRLDYHTRFNWDLHLEGRSLTNTVFDDARSGALVGLYRNFSNTGSLKLGVGYNFTDFSNDLTNLDASYRGWFVNLVGAF